MKKNNSICGVLSIMFFLLHSSLNAQCTATTVPYFESFQGLSSNNQLPPCWAASNISLTCLTMATPSNYAAFFFSPPGVNYFFSGGIKLIAGATYSASLYYKTDNSGGLNWSNLSLLYGNSQSKVGLVNIASILGNVNSATFAPLSGTFEVNATGVYYISIRGTGNTVNPTPKFLFLDDLSITYKCGPSSVNSPTIKPTASAYTICEGSIVNLNATGADNYSWSNGANISNTFVNPVNNPSTYTVLGADSISGCVGAGSVSIQVDPLPQFTVTATPTAVCRGKSVTLKVNGSYSFLWNTGAIAGTITAYPNTTTVYSVSAINVFGCSNSQSIAVAVIPTPTLWVTPSQYIICRGKMLTLYAGGANTYIWNYMGGSGFGDSLVFYVPTLIPPTNILFSVIGIAENGCSSKKDISIVVDECVGTHSLSPGMFPRVIPNPNNGLITVENVMNSSIIVSDISGKELVRKFTQSQTETLILSDLTNGIYFLKIQSGDKIEVRKIVKE